MIAKAFFLIAISYASLARGFYLKQNANLSSGGHLLKGEFRATAIGSNIDKKYLSWGLDLQQPYQEVDLLALLASRSFDHFVFKTENIEELRNSGRLSITYNMDILRDNLMEAIRRNRGRNAVSEIKS